MALGLAIVGYGKMGRLIERLAPEYGFEVRLKLASAQNDSGKGLGREALRGVDVAVEFSNAAAAPENVRRLAAQGVRTVVGTTGWYAELAEVRRAVEESRTGVVWGANFSIGVNLFLQMVAQAAELFAAHPAYEAWGWEIHHAAKKDAPSGTLLRLAESMRASGYEKSIPLSANRAGAHPGTHEIGFDAAEDTITLRHTARSREGFARGALQAARWLAGKQGFFEFREIVSELH
ncbi:MAG TPA: dihydrodipicolinate reductase C-terminal domain-containing protein [Candidatus Acidoferrales bacterium]|jgi:4-hydroxy-tetrahydrodipicolinate reductase